MDSQTDNFIKYVLEIDSNEYQENHEPSVDVDTIKDIIMNKFEETTGCKLYNKLNITSKIDNLKMHEIKHLINQNMIPEISFNTMFKSDLQFTFVFKEDEILVLYKNVKIELYKLADIKTDLLTNEIKFLPIIPEIFVNNITNIIEKLIKKDMSVKYHLIDFPVPYWNLYQIKCKKSNFSFLKDLDKYKYLEHIISGKNCEIINNTQLCEKEDPELEIFLEQIKEMENNNQPIINTKSKESDDLYRMEIMSYLNDDDIIYFLEKMEMIDKIESTVQINIDIDIFKYVNILLNTVSSTPNKMIKYYVVYKIFDFIIKIKDYITSNNIFRNVIIKKINEIQENIYILQSSGLEFFKEFISTLDNCKATIDDIEKSLDPAYVPKWDYIKQ
jgi:hypothetical protein